MCGRYLFKQENDEEIERWLNELDLMDASSIAIKDVYPSNRTIVLGPKEKPMVMQWGLLKWDNKGLVINARSETVSESSFFKDHLENRRCLIKAQGFYEWDKDKRKFLVMPDQNKTFYMAGLYTDDPLPRFCILTRASEGDFAQLHNRIPLMIPEAYRMKYLEDGFNLLEDFKALRQNPVHWENQSPQTSLF